jgi:hypothetical protein
VGGEPDGTSASIHGVCYLFSAVRREGLIADELVLQLATFLGSLDLFLELTVRAVPRTLTTNQVWCGGKQGTYGPELSHIHSSTQHPRDKRRETSAQWRHLVPSHDVSGNGASVTPYWSMPLKRFRFSGTAQKANRCTIAAQQHFVGL